MRHEKWKCQKCDEREFEVGQFAATGGGITKFLNIQNKKFTTVSCVRCGHTEIYRAESSKIGNVFDFFCN